MTSLRADSCQLFLIKKAFFYMFGLNDGNNSGHKRHYYTSYILLNQRVNVLQASGDLL